MGIKRILLKELLAETEQSTTFDKCYTDKGRWADYVIICIIKGENGEISKLGVFNDQDSTLTNGRTLSREEVIKLIDIDKKKVKTAYHVEKDCWRKGDTVHVVSGEFLRTDGNEIKEDNLENLIDCNLD